MGWKVLREEAPHFVIQGSRGEFRVHQGSLRPESVTKFRALCKGGMAGKAKPVPKRQPQKLAEGGTAHGHRAVPLGDPSLPRPASGTGSTFVDALGPGADWLASSRNVDPEVPANFQQDTGQVQTAGAPTGTEGAETPMSSPAESAPAGDNAPTDAAPASTAAAGTPGAPSTNATPEMLQRPSDGPPQLPGMPPMAQYGRAETQLQEALKSGKEGADTQARAETEKQSVLTDAYEQHVKNLNHLEDNRVSESKAVQGAIDKLMGDIESTKIDPRRFWTNKSVGEKALAGMGMILSGIGSGASGQPNMAAQFIQKQIDQDIDAQKANLGKKETLLGFMYKKYGNIQDAALATRGHLIATLAGEVGRAGARAGSQQALATAQILKSQLGMQALAPHLQIINGKWQSQLQQYQLQFQRWAMQNFGSLAGEPGYTPSSTPPPIPSEVSLKGFSELNKARGEMMVNLPELGPNAHTYAPAKVAEEVNKTLPEYKNMDDNLDILLHLGKRNAWNINAPWPDSDKKAYGVAAHALDLSMNQLLKQQRFTQPEDKHYVEMVGKPSDYLFGKTGEANNRALRALVQRERMGEYRRIGLRMGNRPTETPLAASGE